MAAFALAGVLWFGTGNHIAPPVVWAGAAALAARRAGRQVQALARHPVRRGDGPRRARLRAAARAAQALQVPAEAGRGGERAAAHGRTAAARRRPPRRARRGRDARRGAGADAALRRHRVQAVRRLGGLGRHRAVPAGRAALPDRPPDLHDGAAEVRAHAGVPRLPRRGHAAADREVPAEEGLVVLGLREPVGQLRVEPGPGPQAEHHADGLLRALARRPTRPSPATTATRRSARSSSSGTRSAATPTRTTRSARRSPPTT